MDYAFVLRGEKVVHRLSQDEVTGIQAFIALYNRINLNVKGTFDDELKEQIYLSLVPLYLIDSEYPDEGRDGNEDGNGVIEVITVDNRLFPFWNEDILSGFKKASEWLGVSWKDYIRTIIKDGIPVAF